MTREKRLNLQRVITHETFFRIYSKVNKIIYSSLPINLPRLKLQQFLRVFADKEKCPKVQRAITQEVLFKMYSKVNQVVYSSLPVYLSRFKALASIAFEIFG